MTKQEIESKVIDIICEQLHADVIDIIEKFINEKNAN